MATWVCATCGPVPAGEIRHLDHNSPHGHETHECGSSAGLNWTTKEHEMGMYHSTYFAYGVHVDASPYGESERIDEELGRHKDQLPDVGFLMAGNYDDDRLFLTTQCTEVDLGKWEHVTPQSHTAEQLAAWDRQLSDAVDLLGYGDRAVSAPGWLCIPDLS